VNEVADILQIGARNMSNFSLLEAVGELHKPVLLKRGIAATIEELLMAAEYIAAVEIQTSFCVSAESVLLKQQHVLPPI